MKKINAMTVGGRVFPKIPLLLAPRKRHAGRIDIPGSDDLPRGEVKRRASLHDLPPPRTNRRDRFL